MRWRSGLSCPGHQPEMLRFLIIFIMSGKSGTSFCTVNRSGLLTTWFTSGPVVLIASHRALSPWECNPDNNRGANRLPTLTSLTYNLFNGYMMWFHAIYMLCNIIHVPLEHSRVHIWGLLMVLSNDWILMKQLLCSWRQNSKAFKKKMWKGYFGNPGHCPLGDRNKILGTSM